MRNETGLASRLLRYDITMFDTFKQIAKEYLRSNPSCDVHAHPLSFYKITIYSDDRFDIRLHAWLKNSHNGISGESRIHNHTWNLNSVVLLGEVVNSVYELTESPESDLEVFEIVYGKLGSERKRTNQRVVVSSAAETAYRSGDRYSLPAVSFHSTRVPPSTPTLTLVVAEKVPGQKAFVVLPSGSPQTLLYPSTLLDRASATEVASQIASLLEWP